MYLDNYIDAEVLEKIEYELDELTVMLENEPAQSSRSYWLKGQIKSLNWVKEILNS